MLGLMPLIRCLGAFACLLVVSGCADVAPTNPYDPATPTAQQQPGQVIGRLALPAGFGADRLSDAVVSLASAANPGVSAYDSPVEVLDDADARFALGDVAPGAYRLTVGARGLSAEPINIEVGIGAQVDVGVIGLRADQSAAVEGVARRAGNAAAHGGILVEAIGTPYTALTNAEGRFSVPLGPGSYTLRFSAAGHEPQERTGIEVRPGVTTALPDPVVLTGAPGRVRGQIALPAGFDRERLDAVTIALFALMQAEPAQMRTPDPQGLV